MAETEALHDALDFAVDLASRAGDLTLEHFRSGVAVETKADASPVTIADREAERLIRAELERRYPDDGILGEEFGEVRGDASRRWIIDPIDGTRSFTRGVPLYGVMIGLEQDGRSILGVLHFPPLAETVYAARGLGCFVNGRAARVSPVDRLADALVLTTDQERLWRTKLDRGWDRVRFDAGFVRTWGDCYGHALVATGRAEAMIDPISAPWDAAALQPIIEEAGGVFSALDGRATHLGGSAISTNAALGETIRERLSSQ